MISKRRRGRRHRRRRNRRTASTTDREQRATAIATPRAESERDSPVSGCGGDGCDHHRYDDDKDRGCGFGEVWSHISPLLLSTIRFVMSVRVRVCNLIKRPIC